MMPDISDNMLSLLKTAIICLTLAAIAFYGMRNTEKRY